jgi:hypothetical protein
MCPSPTPLVDFCNRDDPRARLPERPNPARPTRGRPLARLTRDPPFQASLVRAWWPAPCEADQPRFHRTGTITRSACSHLPQRSLAERALPRPNPLEHLMSQTRRKVGLESLLRRRRAPVHESAQRPPACACVRLRGPPLAPSREGERDTPHPRCLPPANIPRRGPTVLPQVVPNLWISGPRLLILRPRCTPIDGPPASRGLGRARLSGS